MPKPFVMVELDKPRRMRFSVNAIVELEGILKKPISAIPGSISITDIRALVYCGLRWEDRSLTLDKVGEMLDEADLQVITGQAVEALNLGLGSPEKKDGESAPN